MLSYHDQFEAEAEQALPQLINLFEELHLGEIRSEADYEHMLAISEALLSRVHGHPDHPLRFLFNAVNREIETYEKAHDDSSKGSPVDALRFLMETHGLKQLDLAEDLGGQSVVSAILSGKRKINAQQARALAKRFNVSTDVFIED